MRAQIRVTITALISTLILTACGATGQERHYFVVKDRVTGKPVNFFRLTVNGGLQNSSGRYISGYYDERAVDIFLNEVKTGPSDTVVRPLFDTSICAAGASDKDCAEAMANRYRTVPVGSDSGKNGAFVIIVSNNADKVADAIGAFANHEVVLGSVMQLLNKDEMAKAGTISATGAITTATRSAGMAEIGLLLTDAEAATKADDHNKLYLAALQSIARQLGSDTTINSYEDATAILAGSPKP